MHTFDLKYYAIDEFNNVVNEGERHVKVLPYLSIVQVIEGSYEIALGNDKLTTIDEGCFFIAPTGVKQSIIHHVNNVTGKMSARWLFIDVIVDKKHQLDKLYQIPISLGKNLDSELNVMFNQLFNAHNTLEKYARCYDILSFITTYSTPIQPTTEHALGLAVSYMTKRFNEQITISKLSKISNMSEPNFYAVFKKHYGCSPISYLNHYRLSIALDLLLKSNDTITEIAFSVGINDPFYFSKLFKKTFGLSPKNYKLKYNTGRLQNNYNSNSTIK